MPLMQHVLTLLVATHALVIQASLEMGGHVVRVLKACFAYLK